MSIRYPAYLIVFDLITAIIIGEWHKLRSVAL
jgi:hypothetical protein